MIIILKHLWHYYKDELFLNNGAIPGFRTTNNNSVSFNFKTKIAGRTNNGTKDVKIRVPLAVKLILFYPSLDRCFIIDNPIDDQVLTLAITDTKRYVQVVTISI